MWCDDASRKLRIKFDQFNPEIEFDDAVLRHGTVGIDHVLLVLATFFRFFSHCSEGVIEEVAAIRAYQQHKVVSSYVTRFPEFAMVTKALPFFIVETAQNKACKAAYEKKEACDSALWLANRIDSMGSTRDLVAILSYIVPYTRCSTVSDENKKTIFESIVNAFRRYNWRNFRGGTRFFPQF